MSHLAKQVAVYLSACHSLHQGARLLGTQSAYLGVRTAHVLPLPVHVRMRTAVQDDLIFNGVLGTSWRVYLDKRFKVRLAAPPSGGTLQINTSLTQAARRVLAPGACLWRLWCDRLLFL